MTTITHRIAAVAVALSIPLAAVGSTLARTGEAPADGSAFWHLLGLIGPTALWGLPLAYVVFSVLPALPRHPGVQDRLAEPRDATFVDRLSLFTDSREGW